MKQSNTKPFIGWMLGVFLGILIYSAFGKLIEIYVYTPILETTDIGNYIYVIVALIGLFLSAIVYFGLVKVKLPKQLTID